MLINARSRSLDSDLMRGYLRSSLTLVTGVFQIVSKTVPISKPVLNTLIRTLCRRAGAVIAERASTGHSCVIGFLSMDTGMNLLAADRNAERSAGVGKEHNVSLHTSTRLCLPVRYAARKRTPCATLSWAGAEAALPHVINGGNGLRRCESCSPSPGLGPMCLL